MPILLIEYRVTDFDTWKAVFDRDPLGRASHGVTRHWIYRDSDDPRHLMVGLEFASAEEAHSFRDVLRPVWDVSGAVQAWVLRDTETVAR